MLTESRQKLTRAGVASRFSLADNFPMFPRFFSFFAAIALGISCVRGESADIVIYGGTVGGIAAAIQAKRMGESVVLLDPTKHLGGMMTSGLGATDLGAKSAAGGIVLEFYKRMYAYYENPAMWKSESRDGYLPKHPLIYTEAMKAQWFFEPHVASKLLDEMLKEAGVKVVMDARLDRKSGVVKKGARIESIRTENGQTYSGKVFIDATYEGDLMAAAGVSYTVGREPNSQYRETLNGIVFLPAERTAKLDPYVKAGDPSSGLLPRIEPKSPGAEGEGDKRVQAYNFRMCLTDLPENRVTVEKPANYDPLRYELMLRHLLNRPNDPLGKILFTLVPMPNRKTDSNNTNMVSTDYIGRSYDWAEASYEEREKIWQEHKDYQQGMLWFLANDERVPAKMRAEVAKWGLAKDEFPESGNWPPQLYVREARRMLGIEVVTEADCTGQRKAEDPVALASYAMDSHVVGMFVDENGKLRYEGTFFKSVKPYPVSYRALLPKKAECENLIVPVCASASHAAYGSMRMEPVFMMLGQAAATAAALAVQTSVPLQDVPYDKLRSQLLKDGMVLEAKADGPPKTPAAATPVEAPAQENTIFTQAVDTLADKGILTEKEYWLTHCRAGAKCDGEKVGEIIIKAASSFEPVDNVSAAIDVLQGRAILTSPEYWRTNAVSGRACNGVQTASLIQVLAKKVK